MTKTPKLTIRPVGTHVLVKIIQVEDKSEAGIILATNNELERERQGRDIGTIMDFGPLAYKGYKGALELSGPQDWGVKIGDAVEFRRYDGRIPRTEGYENYRWLNDEDIIGVIE